jgi:hypothetical protein
MKTNNYLERRVLILIKTEELKVIKYKTFIKLGVSDTFYLDNKGGIFLRHEKIHNKNGNNYPARVKGRVRIFNDCIGNAYELINSDSSVYSQHKELAELRRQELLKLGNLSISP